MAYPLCPVCKEPHPPKRFASGGQARCYHCGATSSNCRCYGPQPSRSKRLICFLIGHGKKVPAVTPFGATYVCARCGAAL